MSHVKSAWILHICHFWCVNIWQIQTLIKYQDRQTESWHLLKVFCHSYFCWTKHYILWILQKQQKLKTTTTTIEQQQQQQQQHQKSDKNKSLGFTDDDFWIAQQKISWKTSLVNFTNILRAAFSYKSFTCSFLCTCILGLKFFGARILAQKV